MNPSAVSSHFLFPPSPPTTSLVGAGVEYIPAGSFGESVASTGVSVVASLRNAGGFGGGVPLTNQEIEEWLGDACNNIIKVHTASERAAGFTGRGTTTTIIYYLLCRALPSPTPQTRAVLSQDGASGWRSGCRSWWGQHHPRKRIRHFDVVHIINAPSVLRGWTDSLSRNAFPIGTQIFEDSHEKGRESGIGRVGQVSMPKHRVEQMELFWFCMRRF